MTEIRCALAHAAWRAIRVILVGLCAMMIWKAASYERREPTAANDGSQPTESRRNTNARHSAPEAIQ